MAAHRRAQAESLPSARRISRLFSSGIRFNRVAIYAAAGFAILLGLTFSHSRTGVSLAMLGILVSALIFGRWVGGQRSSRLITAFTVIGVALALEIGLSSVLSRFTGKGMTDDLRWSIFAGTIQGIREFFPIGSGFGTYPAVFRRFQPGNIPEFVNHAHNDYLEWLFEGGLLAGILMIVFLVLYLLRWRKIWPREEYCPPYNFMRISAGIGLLMMGLHGLVDFNLHIPANAVFFAFLAGVFFHQATPGQGSTVAPSAKGSAGTATHPRQHRSPLRYPNRLHLPPIFATRSPTSIHAWNKGSAPGIRSLRRRNGSTRPARGSIFWQARTWCRKSQSRERQMGGVSSNPGRTS